MGLCTGGTRELAMQSGDTGRECILMGGLGGSTQEVFKIDGNTCLDCGMAIHLSFI